MNIKKIIIGFILSLTCFQTFPLINAHESSVELRSGAFFHSSKRFREIYGNASVCFEIEAATRVYNCFEGWINFDWFTKDGRSRGLHDSTRVNIANPSFGLKVPFQITRCISIYVGIGPSLSTIWVKNHSHSHKKTTKFVVGGILKSGLIYDITSCIFADVFVDYLYQPVHFETRVDIGGVKVGGGLGYRF